MCCHCSLCALGYTLISGLPSLCTHSIHRFSDVLALRAATTPFGHLHSFICSLIHSTIIKWPLWARHECMNNSSESQWKECTRILQRVLELCCFPCGLSRCIWIMDLHQYFFAYCILGEGCRRGRKLDSIRDNQLSACLILSPCWLQSHFLFPFVSPFLLIL